MKYRFDFTTLMAAALALPLVACGGDDPAGDDDLPDLFEPQPACEGDEIVPFAGQNQSVISFLEIGDLQDGLDLDGDGDPDNKLAAVGSVAREAIEDALTEYDLLIPLEFFDLDGGAADECVKFSLYLGIYKQDADADGADTAVEDGDCDDTSNARPAAEIAGNRIDDDCDGIADEVDDGMGGQVPPEDTQDLDGDGVTLGDGDCDDSVETGAAVTPGEPEICGDGRDNDCDGVADRGSSSAEACDPFDDTPNAFDIDPLSFDDDGAPLIAFDNGKIEGGKLYAGPSLFQVSIPVIDDFSLDLKITGAQIIADVVVDGDVVRLENGQLGGVLDAQTADNIRGLTVDEIMLTPEDSLLDAAFANVLGALLALPALPPEHPRAGCKTPDIDVDRDGLEAFCDSNLDDEIKTVDLCIDGDGTEYWDEVDGQGNVTKHCTEFTDDSGKPLFKDGISVELNFATTGAILNQP